jgi:hypothetical protein
VVRTEITLVLAPVVPAEKLDLHLIQELIPKVTMVAVLARVLREPAMVVSASSGQEQLVNSHRLTQGIFNA